MSGRRVVVCAGEEGALGAAIQKREAWAVVGGAVGPRRLTPIALCLPSSSPLSTTAAKPGPAAETTSAKATAATSEVETDPRRLEQRRKQIDMGKNTRGYAAYTAAVPR